VATIWDVVDSIDSPLVDTQQTHVRAKTKSASISVVVIAAGALFCAPQAMSSLAVGSPFVSSSIIAIRTVPRGEGSTQKKPVRSERDQYAPDARDGLSTHRLAQTFGMICRPVEEESVDMDFSFG